ncbi:MAG: iron ABC transporter substrate-binding protein [Planctomycetota bacterium]|nr:iron ABC transporter substrate-binding protein [Planctomycetota bacterium]
MNRLFKIGLLPIAALSITLLASACKEKTATTDAKGAVITVYCGRSKKLVDPIIKKFTEDTKIQVKLKYDKTSPLAATLLEEGDKSSADIFFAQDAGALGLLSEKGLLSPIDVNSLDLVDKRFQSNNGDWVGVSGRARVVAYSKKRLKAADLPKSIWDLTDPKWKGRIGWPPKNASFQAFITALRKLEGDAKAKEWIEKMLANEPKVYPKNTPIIAAINAGEIDVGLVNHYYLHRFLAEKGPEFPVGNHYLPGGDAGSLINVAGVAVLKSSANSKAAQKFVEYMLSKSAQEYFAKETHEYPLAKGVETKKGLIPLKDIKQPSMDLNDLKGLKETVELLRSTKVLK